MLTPEHVSGAWAADLLLSTQAYFVWHPLSAPLPLHGLPLHALLPLKYFLECLLTALLPLTHFLPTLLRSALTCTGC